MMMEMVSGVPSSNKLMMEQAGHDSHSVMAPMQAVQKSYQLINQQQQQVNSQMKQSMISSGGVPSSNIHAPRHSFTKRSFGRDLMNLQQTSVEPLSSNGKPQLF